MSGLFNNKGSQEQSSNTGNMSSTRAFIRILAGGYLLYLLYEIIKGGGLTENTGWKLALMAVSLVLFAVFGVLFIIQGVKAVAQMNTGNAEENESGYQESELTENTEEYAEEGYDGEEYIEESLPEDVISETDEEN